PLGAPGGAPAYEPHTSNEPLSLDPFGSVGGTRGAYDSRRPYSAAPPIATRPVQPQSAPPLGPRRAPLMAGGPVTVTPAATLACPLVSALDRWIATAVQPSALRWFGQPVVEIRQISAYSCRGMNGNPNARISEHAFGNALDIASFTLADGRKVTVKDG